MSTSILLVRHGAHSEVGNRLSGRSEIALDPTGMAQAEALAACLASEPIASIHVSPRRRTRETAAPIALRLGHDPCVAPELDEIDFGAFTGRDFADLERDPAWHHWNAARGSARCPGGETMAEAADRALDYLYRLPADDRPALCVTHCDIIRGVVARVLGLEFERMFGFDCDPASVTRLGSGGDGLRLVSLNERLV